jgi:hypothetical protein
MVLVIWPWHELHRKHRFQQFLYCRVTSLSARTEQKTPFVCCMLIHTTDELFAVPQPSNCCPFCYNVALFRVVWVMLIRSYVYWPVDHAMCVNMHGKNWLERLFGLEQANNLFQAFRQSYRFQAFKILLSIAEMSRPYCWDCNDNSGILTTL